MTRMLALLLIMISSMTFAMNPEPATASFSSWLVFSQGNAKQQLMWLSEENGNMLDGPFQGPMAFITDKQENLWVGDSLNARILAFTKQGHQGREYDLIKASKTAGLASAPLLVDLVASNNGKLLVADASNNAIIEIDVRGAQPRAFISPAAPNNWSQINRIHSDAKGQIYVEDVALRRTVILNRDGKPVQVLEGVIGIAVAESSRLALISAVDAKHDGTLQWHVLTCDRPGSALRPLARLNAENPIIWCALIGYDRQNCLYVVYDTPLARHYLALDPTGSIIKKSTTALHDPGYDVNRPDWIDRKGNVFTLQVKPPHLTILRLE